MHGDTRSSEVGGALPSYLGVPYHAPGTRKFSHCSLHLQYTTVASYYMYILMNYLNNSNKQKYRKVPLNYETVSAINTPLL